VKGFIVSDHLDRMPAFLADVSSLVREGKVKFREDIVEGLDQRADGVHRPAPGKNFGKMLVRVGEDKSRRWPRGSLRPALTTESPRAVDAYIEGVDRLLSVQQAPTDAFDSRSTPIPAFALAHIALGARTAAPRGSRGARDRGTRPCARARRQPTRERSRRDDSRAPSTVTPQVRSKRCARTAGLHRRDATRAPAEASAPSD